MIVIFKSILSLLLGDFRSRARMAAEIGYLKHQLKILRRKSPQKVSLSNWDRLKLVWTTRLFPFLIGSTQIITPATLIRWHRLGFRAYWRRKSRNLGGRPRIHKDIANLIREMSLANPLWGAPRIHGELLKLGIEVSQSSVSNHMVRGTSPRAQSWKTFIANHMDVTASLDFLTVPSWDFKILYCLVIVDHQRRRLTHFAVTSNPTAEWVARQVTEAFPWDEAPRYLIRDNDGAFGLTYRRRLRAMGIRDRPTTPHSPWQNAFAERLIGSIRRECLDHVIILNAAHLTRVMRSYTDYYNGARTHLSLGKDAPLSRRVQRTGTIQSTPAVGGLHQIYGRI